MRRWMVTWCANVPVNEYGDSDFDEADYRYVWCDTEAAAVASAKTKAAVAVFGYAEIQPWDTCSRREAMVEEDRATFADKRGQWWIEAGERREVRADD